MPTTHHCRNIVALTTTPRWVEHGGRDYDISPDGERFVVIKEGAAAAEFVVVVNWFEELKRLVPTEN